MLFIDGWYIYTEASLAQKGDKTQLRSVKIPAQKDFCFTFHYHMFGKSMGKLEVFTTPVGNNR